MTPILSLVPVAALGMQAFRQRAATGAGGGGGGRGILRISDRVIAQLSAPGNELYLVIIGILIVAVIILTVLTVREYLLLRRK